MALDVIGNNGFEAHFDSAGHLVSLVARNDERGTNWVVDPAYLASVGYDGAGREFGALSVSIGGSAVRTDGAVQETTDSSLVVRHELPGARIDVRYDLGADPRDLEFSISVENRTAAPLEFDQLAVWTPFADVMFRDPDVQRNMQDSVAVFPAISPSYTRLAMHRRSGLGPHLGLFQTAGRTESVGTWCAWTNRFFEDVSPSLDGVLFHQLVLAGGYPAGLEPVADWIYPRDAVLLAPGERRTWTYRLTTYTDIDDVAQQGRRLGHPTLDVDPVVVVGQQLRVRVEPPLHRRVSRIAVRWSHEGEVRERDMSSAAATTTDRVSAEVAVDEPGEHQVLVEFDDGTVDQAVVTVTEPLASVLAARADHVADVLYEGPDGDTPYAFRPVSNQGESLGKLTFVLAQNLLGELDLEQVRRVEQSVVHYVRPKWFIDGDFGSPRRLYGDFYRVMDFEYIAHLFFLLSRLDDSVLVEHSASTYLAWAADVFAMRIEPDRHEDERGKAESRMLGVHFLYVDDLLAALRESGLEERHRSLSRAWEGTLDRVAAESDTYGGAVTEHFYDNAGFGPSAGALCGSGRLEAGRRYAELLAANIGFSNDFRAQAPDRWWEALSPMVHALWGGVAAAAMLRVYEAIPDHRFLLAAHRATVAVLYCYDTAATATALRLAPGEAASTYSISGPNRNRPDLSRNRFGQSTFARDGGIFTRLFPDGEGTPDWDMGEELVAYLQGFGRKTYLYEGSDGEVHVVNGSLERTERGLRVTSHAAYPLGFHFLERDLHLTLDEPARVVDLIDDAFVVPVAAGTTQ